MKWRYDIENAPIKEPVLICMNFVAKGEKDTPIRQLMTFGEQVSPGWWETGSHLIPSWRHGTSLNKFTPDAWAYCKPPKNKIVRPENA